MSISSKGKQGLQTGILDVYRGRIGALVFQGNGRVRIDNTLRIKRPNQYNSK